MTTYQLHFTVPTGFNEINEDIPIPEDISFWMPLMQYFINKSNMIEIHCWYEEKEVIKEAISLFDYPSNYPNNYQPTIFRGELTENRIHTLLNYFLTENKEIKWFSIFLKKDAKTTFHSEHWGTEFFAPNVSEDDIAFIKSMLPKDTDFNQYV
ncbi:hypothetical protein [Paenisporosarcina cavernae]|uniref:hypothetical protein n=1 Tax=Paenisporosarcina cavernae TaxID=2320858 RepID=UPI001EE54BE4|nr:hypothetical protein [Paenisporosarcina cavernae]